MIKVVGINFEDSKKIYYFSPNGFELNINTKVIVETERGKQFGYVVTDYIEIDENKLNSQIKNVIKIADKKDIGAHKKNLRDSEKAIIDANRFIEELNLDMKILNANFTFDRTQLLFNFLADDRVDFRVLAKKLAAIYRTRIELRQIGVRDKAREIGGFGQCGRTLCCSLFLKDLNTVSINMAKNQNLALNPQKINGSCGRLMCCLAYENDLYDEYKKGLPNVGEVIKTKEVNGKVIDVDIFSRKYKIEKEDGTVEEITV